MFQALLNRPRHPLPLALVCLTGLPAVAYAAPGFQGLGDLPGGDYASQVLAISADGSTAVGKSTSASGTEAFRWTLPTGITGLSDLAGGTFNSTAYGVSGDGSVIVGEGQSASGLEACQWSPTPSPQGMGTLPRLSSTPYGSCATAVSADGKVIVGHSYMETTVDSYSLRGHHAFAQTPITGMVDLDSQWSSGLYILSRVRSINLNGSMAVGAINVDYDIPEPCYWTGGNKAVILPSLSVPDDLPIRFGFAEAASADGSVIVGVLGPHPVRWVDGSEPTILGGLPGDNHGGAAYATTADGSIVVGQSAGQAFIWDETHGMRSLSAVLSNLGVDLTGWTLTDAQGISADGRFIVGNGINPAGKPEAWMVTIPEPSTLALATPLFLLLCHRPRKTAPATPTSRA